MSSLPLIIHIFDVGQGSSILIETPSGFGGQPKYGLIDCFSQISSLEPKALTYLKSKSAKSLEFIILTHPDGDHFMGLGSVLEYFTSDSRTVEMFVEGPITLKDKVINLFSFNQSSRRYSEEVTELARIQKGLLNVKKYTTCDNYQGKVVSLIPQMGFEMKILYPTSTECDKLKKNTAVNLGAAIQSGVVQKKSDFNSTSLVFSIKYGEANFLITGDVCESSWKDLYGYKELPSDLVTVAHHGGSGNPAKLWKNIASPVPNKTVAILSCGTGNKYRHPSTHTLNNILSTQCALFCTEKGNPCKDLDDPADKSIERVAKTLTDKFLGTVSKLGGKPCQCSGDMVFELYASGEIKLIKRESPAECVYSAVHHFKNEYTVPLGRSIV